MENKIIKIEKGIAYLKLSNLSSNEVKLNKAKLGTAEKISNTNIKSLRSQELSINFTSQEHVPPKPQPQENYGMIKTNFLKHFNLEHLPENTKTREKNILWDYKWTFARHEADYGLTYLIT